MEASVGENWQGVNEAFFYDYELKVRCQKKHRREGIVVRVVITLH